ncbi:hypothetical protein U1Q18_009428 [Sarracenia purpurea var. burkii]
MSSYRDENCFYTKHVFNSRSNEKAEEAIIYSYTRDINGFAATLDDEEAAQIANFTESGGDHSPCSISQYYWYNQSKQL